MSQMKKPSSAVFDLSSKSIIWDFSSLDRIHAHIELGQINMNSMMFILTAIYINQIYFQSHVKSVISAMYQFSILTLYQIPFHNNNL